MARAPARSRSRIAPLVAWRMQLRKGVIDRVEAAGRAAHAYHVALEAGPGRVRIALDRDAPGRHPADLGLEFRAVIAVLVADALPLLDLDALEGIAKALAEIPMLQVEPRRIDLHADDRHE